MNSDNSVKIAAALFNIGSVIIRPNKPFRYDSGIISPIYVDNRLTISFTKERKLIIDAMVKKIKEIGLPDVIAGTATAGIPHAAFIAQKLNLPMVYVRSKPKDHGKGNQIEGVFKKGQRIIVIEDLVSTGGSSIRVIKSLRKMGAKINAEVCIFTYGLKDADKNFKNHKVKLHSLTDFKTSTEVAVKNGFLKKDQVKTILEWAKDPKNWDKRRKDSNSITIPVYDVKKSWEYNYKKGPNFKGPYPKLPKKKKWHLLGYELISPLGVAAGPLPNSKWMIPYLKLGYGSITQKTVRSSAHKSHPEPNITFVKKEEKLTLDKKPIIVEKEINDSVENLSITNSFGNPCKSPNEWINEAKKTKRITKKGQLFGISIYGTAEKDMTLEDLAKDYAKTASLAKKAGAQFIEANLACPNVSGAENPFLYKDSKAVRIIAKSIKSRINKTPLVLKIGYFSSYKEMKDTVLGAKGYFEAISAINTIQKKVLDQKGNQALPGREVSGVCGYAIKEYGIETVKNLVKARKKLKSNFEIIGVGGAMQPVDVIDYLKAGADHVHSATAVMWNPYLAYDLHQFLQNNKIENIASISRN